MISFCPDCCRLATFCHEVLVAEDVTFLEWLTDPCAVKMESLTWRLVLSGIRVVASSAFSAEMRSEIPEVVRVARTAISANEPALSLG